MSRLESIAEAFAYLSDSDPDLRMIVAILERVAADFYRGWASGSDDPIERNGFLECAASEDRISAFIESLEADPTGKIRELNARFPQMRETYDSLMAGRTRNEQLRIQAEGEMGGADLMLQFSAATEGAVSARFAALALCEESNSRFLRKLIGEGT